MHEELWEGVHLKVQHAEFFLEEMGRVLHGPERTHMNVVLQSTGAIIDTEWQRAFYPNFDAFLAMTRSVPEVVHACFGHDRSPAMKAWFDALDVGERTRRDAFTAAFKGKHEAFQKLPLSNARNVSMHRSGVAPVTVQTKSLFGVMFVGSPVKRLPIAHSWPAEIGGGLLWESPLPLLPHWQDFSIDGKSLFDECRRFLGSALALVADGQSIAQQVHSSDPLTPPP